MLLPALFFLLLQQDCKAKECPEECLQSRRLIWLHLWEEETGFVTSSSHRCSNLRSATRLDLCHRHRAGMFPLFLPA